MLVKAVGAKLQMNPLLLPLGDEEHHPHIQWNMLFSTAHCHRSTDPSHRSWSNGRQEPATFPRVTELRLVSRAFPSIVDIRATNRAIGITCGDLIEQLSDHLQRRLRKEDYEGAAALCEKGDSYFAKILLAGFQAVGVGGETAPLEAMELSATEETFKLNAKISYINLIGNLGPLVGLLGTVTGMISSFQVIATLKSPTPKDLAEGVYESLVNTTMGLAIALGFLTVFFIYKNKIQQLTLQANSIAHDVLKRVAAH